MKKLFFLCAFVLFNFSCSKDDETPKNCMVCDTIESEEINFDGEVTTSTLPFNSVFPDGFCAGENPYKNLLDGLTGFLGAFGGGESDDLDDFENFILDEASVKLYLSMLQQDCPSCNCRLE